MINAHATPHSYVKSKRGWEKTATSEGVSSILKSFFHFRTSLTLCTGIVLSFRCSPHVIFCV